MPAATLSEKLTSEEIDESKVFSNYLCIGLDLGLKAATQAYKKGAYQKALELVQTLENEYKDVKNSEVFLIKGMSLRALEKFDEALPFLEEAARTKPVIPEAFRALSHSYLMAKRYDDAIGSAEKYIRLCPESCLGYFDAGNALCEKLEYAQAVEMYRQAISKDPKNYASWLNLGVAYRGLRDKDAALAACDKAIEIAPWEIMAHRNKGFVLLRAGEWKAGWPEYEWRWECLEKSPYKQPWWKGARLKDKTLFVRAEQGFGDALQFARYLPQVRERIGNVILECRPGLKKLFEESALADVVIGMDEIPPAFDCQVLMASLPAIFSSSPEDVPSRPYLRAGKTRSGAGDGNLKVGIVWQGSTTHKNDAHRSIPLNELRPILDIEGITFYSLQTPLPGRDKTTFAEYENSKKIINLEDRLMDYSETAALVEQMDLVLCVDTSVAHLAGGLGRETWTFIPHNPDWRWGLETSGTPWYPNMRLLRQSERGNWAATIQETAEMLGQRVLIFPAAAKRNNSLIDPRRNLR
jgi:tetratricopeptide (TPR) repeat protein